MLRKVTNLWRPSTQSALGKSVCAVCYFFFFQAEDGIRDYKVTGVQTCALPIWVLVLGAVPHQSHEGIAPGIVQLGGLPIHPLLDKRAFSGRCRQQVRSEERRVGKECRSRWSPYH